MRQEADWNDRQAYGNACCGEERPSTKRDGVHITLVRMEHAFHTLGDLIGLRKTKCNRN